MITYGNRKLGDQLTDLFARIKEFLNNNSFDNLISDFKENASGKEISVDKAIEKIITDNTNMKVTVEIDSPLVAAIMPFPFNRNHVLLKDFVRDMYYLKGEKEILKNSKDKIGTVDLEKVTLGGIFTEYEHTLYLNLKLLLVTYDFTPAEMTAVVMHEIGHVFTYYEYSNRVNSTNQLLAELAEEIHNKKQNPEKIELIFKEVKNNMRLSEEEYNDLISSVDKVIFGPKLFSLYIRNITGLRQTIKYDETSSEALADNFAVRMGYGKELVIALDKLHKYSPERNDVVLMLFLTTEFIFDFILTPILIIFLLTAFPYAIVGFVLAILLMLEFLGSGNLVYKDMTYDELKQRYNRVRQAMIGRLKDLKIKPNEAKEIVYAVEQIDDLMKEVNNSASLKERLLKDFLPSSRKVSKDMQRQQDIEELSFNPLFVASAKLKFGE